MAGKPGVCKMKTSAKLPVTTQTEYQEAILVMGYILIIMTKRSDVAARNLVRVHICLPSHRLDRLGSDGRGDQWGEKKVISTPPSPRPRKFTKLSGARACMQVGIAGWGIQTLYQQ